MKTNTNKKDMKTIKVNLTTVETPWQVTAAFVDAKVDNRIPIEPWELETYAKWNYVAGVEDVFDLIRSTISTALVTDTKQLHSIIAAVKPKKKPNIFKRFWNWVTRKK